jgi:hypothetical protein
MPYYPTHVIRFMENRRIGKTELLNLKGQLYDRLVELVYSKLDMAYLISVRLVSVFHKCCDGACDGSCRRCERCDKCAKCNMRHELNKTYVTSEDLHLVEDCEVIWLNQLKKIVDRYIDNFQDLAADVFVKETSIYHFHRCTFCEKVVDSWNDSGLLCLYDRTECENGLTPLERTESESSFDVDMNQNPGKSCGSNFINYWDSTSDD